MIAIKRCGFIKLLISAMFLLVFCWGLTGCTDNYNKNLAYGYSDAYYLLCEEGADHLEYSQKNYVYYIYRDIALHDEEEANYIECTQKSYECYLHEDIALYDDEIDYLDGNLTTYYDYQENEIPTTNNLDDETNVIMHIRQTVDIVGHWHYVGTRDLHTGRFYRCDFRYAMQSSFVFSTDGTAIDFFYGVRYGLFELNARNRFAFRPNYAFCIEDGWMRFTWVSYLTYIPQSGLLRDTWGGISHYYERFIPPEIQVQIATYEILSQFDNYHEFIELSELSVHGYFRVILTTNTVLYNFRYFAHQGIRQHDARWINICPPLNVIGKIEYDKPFVFTWMGYEVMSYRKISFSDTSGRSHRFTFHFCTKSETVYLERAWFWVFPSSPKFPFEL